MEGSVIVKVVPLPGSDSILISPLCKRMIPDDIAKPSPSPSEMSSAFFRTEKWLEDLLHLLLCYSYAFIFYTNDLLIGFDLNIHPCFVRC